MGETPLPNPVEGLWVPTMRTRFDRDFKAVHGRWPDEDDAEVEIIEPVRAPRPHLMSIAPRSRGPRVTGFEALCAAPGVALAALWAVGFAAVALGAIAVFFAALLG